MTTLFFLLALIPDTAIGDSAQAPDDALHPTALVSAVNGLWKIQKSKSLVQVDGVWRQSNPKWRYTLFIDGTIITFQKNGEPHYWATTTRVVTSSKSGRTLSFDAKDTSGVKRKGILKLGNDSNTMELATLWSDIDIAPGHKVPFRFKSERSLEKVKPETQLKLLSDLMKGCKFLGKEPSKDQELVQQFIASQQNAKNDGAHGSPGVSKLPTQH